MMTLKKFRVKNFRSVMDSGWIDCDNITSLVGVNEAGKSNIILALWKLKPARGGKIDLLHDMPTKEYSSWRSQPEQYEFISAFFELDEVLMDKVVALTKCDISAVSLVQMSRKYDGKYLVSFPNYTRIMSIPPDKIVSILSSSKDEISNLKKQTKSESDIENNTVASIEKILSYVSNKDSLGPSDFEAIKKLYAKGIKQVVTSDVFQKYESMRYNIEKEFAVLNVANPTNSAEARQLMVNEMPTFVYYSNYGNLDAQIYLPHVVKLLNGERIEGFDNQAKVRTLRVLFDFVNLSPQEVLDLGKDPIKIIRNAYGAEQENVPSEKEIADATRKKEERATLLQSASSKLTREFADWWKQGNYKFRLQADGDFFKIWVSDEKRPEEIELERRSTGLQWFLSFFLIFLVESNEAHKGTILLLDEAGLTLHPMAQKDLVAFFDNLSKTNQIIHTTHSPFLVDTSNIDRVKVVYLDDNGCTVASSDLRAANDKLNEKSIYAVHAALGLSVSDILLQGCQPIIVEGPSDQFYLNAIKLFLIKNQKFTPCSELIFMPSGGVKGIQGIVGIVTGRDGKLPIVVLDSDKNGKDAKAKLQANLYVSNRESLIETDDITGIQNSEIEDIIPISLMTRYLDSVFHNVETSEFKDVYNNSKPIIPQIENFAAQNNTKLEKWWKVPLAKSVKSQLQRTDNIPNDYLDKWNLLFSKFNSWDKTAK